MSIIPRILRQKLLFQKVQYIPPSKGRLDEEILGNSRCASSKGMVYLLKENFVFWRGIYCSCKNTPHCSKGRWHLLRRVCRISVLNTDGYVVIMLKMSAKNVSL